MLSSAKKNFYHLFSKIVLNKESWYRGVSLIFIIFSGCVALWFVSKLTVNLWQYYQCSKPLSCYIQRWEVVEKLKGEYTLLAHYQYKAKGHHFKGIYHFKEPKFNNRYIAKEVLQSYQNKQWPVWVSPSRPHISTLQRHFSIKLCVQCLLSIGVFIYFIWLKEYLTHLNPIKNPQVK